MKLYIYEHCPFCARARMIFGLKQMAVELRVVMEGDAETPIRLIGKKAVPILEKPDGTHMGESLDIVSFVDSLGSPVLTAPANPLIDRWGQEVWVLALKLFIPRFTQASFAELSTLEAREAYRIRETQAFGDLDALLQATPQLIEKLVRKLDELALLLKAHRGIGMSDIKLWPILRSLSIVKGLPFPWEVQAYMERYEKRCGVELLFDREVAVNP